MFQFEELSQLPRKELQLLAKSHGLKANAANSVLIEQLLNCNNNNSHTNNNATESTRSSTSTVDTTDNQFPGLIQSVKAELECKLLIESNKVPLRKSFSSRHPDQQEEASSPEQEYNDDELEASGKWAVSMQKCIGELVKSDSFVACASKFHSASKPLVPPPQQPQPSEANLVRPVKSISPTKSFISSSSSSSLPVVSISVPILLDKLSSLPHICYESSLCILIIIS